MSVIPRIVNKAGLKRSSYGLTNWLCIPIPNVHSQLSTSFTSLSGDSPLSKLLFLAKRSTSLTVAKNHHLLQNGDVRLKLLYIIKCRLRANNHFMSAKNPTVRTTVRTTVRNHRSIFSGYDFERRGGALCSLLRLSEANGSHGTQIFCCVSPAFDGNEMWKSHGKIHHSSGKKNFGGGYGLSVYHISCSKSPRIHLYLLLLSLLLLFRFTYECAKNTKVSQVLRIRMIWEVLIHRKKKNVTRWVAVPNLQELPLKLTASPCIFIGLNYGT